MQGSDGYFYGTTDLGGDTNLNSGYGYGTVFKISPSGELTTLYSFTDSNDGAYPQAGLVRGSDGNFYGTTFIGGMNNSGTVFQINATGALTTLYSFSGGNDGLYPTAPLLQGSDGSFYGTTWQGGLARRGTVFRLTLVPEPPKLTITRSETNVILKWRTYPIGFTLELTASLDSPVVWQTNPTPAVVIGGQNVVTNPVTVTQMFFRLSQ